MQRVFLHVGAPKTGTTYLQGRLALNRGRLAKQGVKYPLGLRDTMFLAALDLTQVEWPGFDERADGEWRALVRRIRASRGTAVVSHEIFAVATRAQIAQAMADLDGIEVHVVFTSRDPARQLAAHWQEELKTYHCRSFRGELERLRDADPMRSKNWFWRAQHLPRALANWSEHLPAERVHLITIPQGRSDALWTRFCAVTGIDPAWAPEEEVHANQSLGIIGAQVLRTLNRQLRAQGVDAIAHRDLVLDTVVPTLLEVEHQRPIVVPPDLDGWVDSIAEQWIRWARTAGIDVVGDLDELRPAARTGTWDDPDDLRVRRVMRVMARTTAAVIAEGAARQAPEMTLPARVRRVGRRVKRRLVVPD